jgi:hypothetical protein
MELQTPPSSPTKHCVIDQLLTVLHTELGRASANVDFVLDTSNFLQNLEDLSFKHNFLQDITLSEAQILLFQQTSFGISHGK